MKFFKIKRKSSKKRVQFKDQEKHTSSVTSSELSFSSQNSQVDLIPSSAVSGSSLNSDIDIPFKITKKIQSGQHGAIYFGRSLQYSDYEVVIKVINKHDTKELIMAKAAYAVVPEFTLPVIYSKKTRNTSESSSKSDLGSNKSADPSGQVIMVQEKYGKSLYDVMAKDQQVLPFKNLRYIYWQVLLAVNLLQKHGIYHLDLKEENILLDEKTMRIKIIDFGVSRTTPIPMNKVVGSVSFAAPEVMFGLSCANSIKKHDIWSFGVCLYSSITGKLPYKNIENVITGKENIDLNLIAKSLIKERREFGLGDDLSDDEIFDFCDLLKKIFEIRVERRIGFSQLLKSGIFLSRREFMKI